MNIIVSRFARRWARPLIAGAALAASIAPGLAMNVQPVIIDLQSTGRRASAVISLHNTFAETVPVEVTAHPVRVVDGELREAEEEEAENLLVFPSQATVNGGETQAFRVQWVGDPLPTQSEHFYVTVSQLPVTLPDNQNAIQVLHQFKILVSASASSSRPELKVTKVEIRTDESGKPKPVLTVANEGAGYGYVGNNRMTVVQRAESGAEVFRETFEPDQIQQRMGLGLVPSGQTRVLPINLELPEASGALSIELTPAESL